jgi:DNA invertase Pin-like site-specific DNA recombinase
MMACYCRVSTLRQKADGQKADILRWLTGHVVASAAVQWFEDVDSGSTLKRPAFDRLQQGIFAGTIRTVVVWKLDRISRRQREGVNLLADWCERGVRVVVITQQLDLSGAVGRLVASVLFGLAEIEQEYRRERQAAGIAVATARPLSGSCQRDDKGPARARPDALCTWIHRGGDSAGPPDQYADRLSVSGRLGERVSCSPIYRYVRVGGW